MATSLTIDRVTTATLNEVRVLTEVELTYLREKFAIKSILTLPDKYLVHLRIAGMDVTIEGGNLINEYAFTRDELDSHLLLADLEGINYLIKLEDFINQLEGEKLMKMNKELLAQAYKDLEGDLGNQYLGFQKGDNIVVKNSATGNYLSVGCSTKSIIQQSNLAYVSTVEEFNNYFPEVYTAKNTILGMETFMGECGILEAWNDNKSKYLGEV